MVITPVEIHREKRIELQIQSYADSINSISKQEFPRFLFNPCLDLDKSLWIQLEPRSSIRWSIFERVNNKAALERIVSSKDKRLRLKCKNIEKSWHGIPYTDKSNAELARKRLKSLK
jgi:hypothetical protein